MHVSFGSIRLTSLTLCPHSRSELLVLTERTLRYCCCDHADQGPSTDRTGADRAGLECHAEDELSVPRLNQFNDHVGLSTGYARPVVAAQITSHIRSVLVSPLLLIGIYLQDKEKARHDASHRSTSLVEFGRCCILRPFRRFSLMDLPGVRPRCVDARICTDCTGLHRVARMCAMFSHPGPWRSDSVTTSRSGP